MKKAYSLKLSIFLLSIILMLLYIIPVNSEHYNWDCPNCGRTNNTGNYCGTCAQPSPAPESGPITVNSWKELQETIYSENNITIAIASDIIAKTDDSAIIIPTEKNIQINLHGHCIDRASKETQCDDSAIIINSQASLTIFDETQTGRITGGNTKALGGAIYNKGTLIINGVIIEDNTASQGGGIFIDYDATLQISNSKININTATKDGGAIYNHGNISMNNCVVHGNMCHGGGSGIWSDGTATLESVEIEGNLYAVNGGAIASHGITTLTNCTIKHNTTSSAGGAIFHSNNSKPSFEASLTMNDVTIENNTAQTYGGGIYIGNGTVILQGNTFISGNEAQKAGGGIFFLDGNLLIQDALIVQNNTSNKKENDLHIRGFQDITLNGPLYNNARIGVHLQNSNRTFTNGYSKYTSIDPDLIFFDNSGKKVLLNNNEVTIK